MTNWQTNTARDHWSEVLDQAETEGPQIITHDGKERAVVLSIDAYRSLERDGKPDAAKSAREICSKERDRKPDLITFLLNAPKIDWGNELERDKSVHDREIDF